MVLHENELTTITLEDGLLEQKWSGNTDSDEAFKGEIQSLNQHVKSNDVSKVLINGSDFTYHIPVEARAWAYQNMEGLLHEKGISKVAFIYPSDKKGSHHKQYFTDESTARNWLNS